jgi:hypothetical protein
MQFASIIIKGFGFTTLRTLLVQMLGSVFQLVFVAMCTIGSTYFTNVRTCFIAWNLALFIIGAAMICHSLISCSVWGQHYCLFNVRFLSPYCAGNITDPELFFEKKREVTSIASLL